MSRLLSPEILTLYTHIQSHVQKMRAEGLPEKEETARVLEALEAQKYPMTGKSLVAIHAHYGPNLRRYLQNAVESAKTDAAKRAVLEHLERHAPEELQDALHTAIRRSVAYARDDHLKFTMVANRAVAIEVGKLVQRNLKAARAETEAEATTAFGPKRAQQVVDAIRGNPRVNQHMKFGRGISLERIRHAIDNPASYGLTEKEADCLMWTFVPRFERPDSEVPTRYNKYKETGAKHGVTASRVHSIVFKALGKISRKRKKENLRT